MRKRVGGNLLVWGEVRRVSGYAYQGRISGELLFGVGEMTTV